MYLKGKMERDFYKKEHVVTRKGEWLQTESGFRLDSRKKFFREVLVQAAQRSCGCLTPGSVQGQERWGFEQPDLVEVFPDQQVGTR